MDALKTSASDNFYKTSINRLQHEISEKKNLTYDFKDGFRFVSYMKKDKQH